MRFVRVAVECATSATRLAGLEDGGAPQLLAELPAGTAPDAALREILGRPPDDVVLVHAVGRAPAVPGWVRSVPAPVAAAGRGTHVVLDVGRSGARATLVHAGTVAVHRSCGVGGDALDAVVRALRDTTGDEARRLRESLSLQPVASLPGGSRLEVEELRDALAPVLDGAVAVLRDVVGVARRPVPVLLVGGVARTPLLAERVDVAGVAEAVVAPVPDAAAVLGALGLWPAGPRTVAAETDVPLRWLPPPPGPRPGRAVLGAVLAIGVAAGLLGAGRLLPASGPPPVPEGVLVQYGYRLDVPAGWEHTGGLPERRRVLLTPAATPDGSDLVAVERSPLGYDADAEPERAEAELRGEFDAAVAAGADLTDYDPHARVAGRPATTYRQRDGATVVEWTVLLDGDAQLSVGCRATAAGAEAVRAACAVVVASVRRA